VSEANEARQASGHTRVSLASNENQCKQNSTKISARYSTLAK